MGYPIFQEGSVQIFRNLITVLIFCFLNYSSAHPGGHGSGPEKLIRCESAQDCTRAEAERAGAFMIEMLTAENQLVPTWSTAARVGNARVASVDEINGWVIEYHNPQVTDQEKQNLFIVITKDGFLIGTTFDKNRFTERTLALQLIGLSIIAILSLLGWFVFLRKPKMVSAT